MFTMFIMIIFFHLQLSSSLLLYSSLDMFVLVSSAIWWVNHLTDHGFALQVKAMVKQLIIYIVVYIDVSVTMQINNVTRFFRQCYASDLNIYTHKCLSSTDNWVKSQIMHYVIVVVLNGFFLVNMYFSSITFFTQIKLFVLDTSWHQTDSDCIVSAGKLSDQPGYTV